ncbi:hypothetical protein DL764_001871 [Monosporascus ibericus]|uniref:Uncharacterized protein n=1 Tax=Monosporascus ibericus TaxID=155417 RepID=A0A4Q4TSP0_9PEZI|nr:hypothetical protein DL764_001871 [Monosporascus ibericus]
MSTSGTSKVTSETKARGLKINTNLPPGVFHYFSADENVTQKSGIFAQMATAPAAKQTFSTENCRPATPKISEAMLSTDWRKNSRPQDPLPTAPPKKVQFSSDGIKPKKLHIDTAAANNYGMCRYRATPIDPEFIHSAPATKREYGLACEDEGNLNYHIERGQSINSQEVDLRHLVRLKGFTPIQREDLKRIWDQDGQSLGFAPGKDSSSASPFSPFMIVSPVNGINSFQSIEFPLAEIREVRNSKRFCAKRFEDLDNSINQSLSALEPPRTTGLPIDTIRQEYERDQAKKEEQSRFEALLQKLQARRKSATTCPYSRRPSVVDVKPPYWSKDSKEKEPASLVARREPVQRRPSHDSAISGISIEDEKKPSYLNPEASEFHIPSSKETPPQIPSMEKFLELSDKVESLKAELAREKLMNENAILSNIQLALNPQGYLPVSTGVPRGAAPSNKTQLLPEPPTPPQHQTAQPATPEYLAQYPYATGSLNPTCDPADKYSNRAHIMAPPGLPVPIQTRQDGLGMSQPCMTTENMMASAGPQPIYVHNGLTAGPPASTYPITIGSGSINSNDISIPQRGIPSTIPASTYPFGPRPVRKPRGPVRQGDARQAMQQQEYEMYLEHKRATDPDYAKACKARQQRRAEKQRAGQA